jgi:ribose-phosphate pyrophosphokinase
MKFKLISPNFKDILKPNINVGVFPDGDSHVYIPNIKKLKNKEIILYHRLYPKQNDSLIELLLILGIIQKEKLKVTLVAPYLPYARQDKIILQGEGKSAEEICKLIKNSGCDKLITFDCHFLKKEGEFVYGGLPIKNISLGKEFLSYARKLCNEKNLEIIAPDEGASYLVQKQQGKIMKKKRDLYDKNKISYRHIKKMHRDFDIKGKNVLVLDDMISTGSTMIKAVENLKSGGTKKIYCAATHGFFLNNSLNKLKNLSDGVFVSNTIPSIVSKINIINKI